MEKVLIISNRNIDSFGYHSEMGFNNQPVIVDLYDYYFSNNKLLRFLIIPLKFFHKSRTIY